MGPAYPQQMYEDAQKCVDDPSHTFRYNHCMLYEHTRNYIFPDEFTKVFEYSLDDTDSNYGWTNQGFIDILGCLLLDHMCSDGEKVELEYYGNNRDGFMISMEEELDNYLKHEYSYEETFEHHLLPWNQNKSLDNVIAGILSRFYREFGYGFMLRWFRCIPLLQKRLPPRSLKPCDRQSGIDNFYIAASFGACCDQYDYFCGSLQWPVSDDGREFYEKHKSDNLYDK
ncbi:hypothetical protein SARC_12630 [Sphaeroforma arctica JP610]|uniref:Uncharacterized protein n=1 Tax=Sphaeroforma arctica JP610 TaxID=667725 RepID=A0A0L0FDJ5_9EUKA|nr:hypothetical protein SARC_12630 [Sphaeroforma arctica JP610]KNC74830.1 hypothetical protein SARC_12630 [Sphaeroforma arctica JP610]|eukprot:XP_014148732.1 hypothetical protein SARC_12630 [Sphaeroforma arctica JP610]